MVLKVSVEESHSLTDLGGQSEDGQSESLKGHDRKPWSNRVEFLLAIVGYTVGVGSLWRFPILCARNGGGAFLIPFFLFMAITGAPLYYMEVCLGQFAGKSAGAAFEFCPLFKGLGALMVTLSLTVLWYYMVVNAWALFYLYNSFKAELPWATCNNWWNTPHCRDPQLDVAEMEPNVTTWEVLYGNSTVSTQSVPIAVNYSLTSLSPVVSRDTSPAEEFWMYNVLRQSDGLENMGSIQWHLVICHFLSYLVVVLAVIKGTRSLGKVVYVTATLPYVLLTVLFIRGATLDGAIDGIIYYLRPDFQKLLNIQVWIEAAVQVFFSLGPTWGGVITMASFNKFHNKSARETVIVVAADAFTAFYCGLVVFTIVGFMAKEHGLPVEEVAKASGHGLAFIAYPTAVSRMPLPQLWAVLFFLTLFSLALDSDFGMFETVSGALIDVYDKQLHNKKPLVNIATGIALFLLSWPLLTKGGIYLFTLSDWYFSAFGLFVGSIAEVVAICWVYGADRFSRDIELMSGRETGVFMRLLWCLVIPVILTACFVVSLLKYSHPVVGSYRYQPYAIVIGMLGGLLPIFILVGKGLWQIAMATGTLKQRIASQTSPSVNWGPNDHLSREIYHMQPYHNADSVSARVRRNLFGSKETPCL